MRILAISDVVCWDSFEGVLRKHKPDITALAGDLVSDGWAAFWSEALEHIPAYKKQRAMLMRRLGISRRRGIYQLARKNDSRSLEEWTGEFRSRLDELKEKFRHAKEFDRSRRRLHVDKFYEFLEFAGQKTPVLVVKGDHDSDFDGDYVPGKIDAIGGCCEITGQTRCRDGVTFLGLGFDDTHYRRLLRRHIENYKGRVDVVLAHSEQSAVPLLGELRPRLLIRGHFGSGRYLVSGVPSAFTADVHHTIIDYAPDTLPRMQQYLKRQGTKTAFMESTQGCCRPWFSDQSEYERYPWLKPYPTKSTLNRTSIQ